jgi:hypothetical protein
MLRPIISLADQTSPSPDAIISGPQICAKLHIRNAEPVALTADLAVGPPASSSSMNRVSAFC